MAKFGFTALAVSIVVLILLAIWFPSLASPLGGTAGVLFLVLCFALIGWVVMSER